jgi:hypothetical protein
MHLTRCMALQPKVQGITGPEPPTVQGPLLLLKEGESRSRERFETVP